MIILFSVQFSNFEKTYQYLPITNATGIDERSFITQNDGLLGKGDIHFGFNISRVFTIKKPEELKTVKW